MRRILLVLALAFSPLVHASGNGFTTRGSHLGENTIIRDNRSGLEWLRLDLTYNRSFLAVASDTQPGGLYEGFIPASESLLRGLFSVDRAFLPAPIPFGSTPPTAQQAQLASAILSMFGGGDGNTSAPALSCWSQACFDAGIRQRFIAGIDGSGWGFILDDSSVYGGLASPNQGTWLVSVTPVPEPQTWVLMAAGIGAVFLMRRRRR